jgi:ABC-2 type transport system permease protein
VASLFRSALTVQLASAAIGLPFFFLAGFAWPSEAIPQAVRLFSVLVPSTFAIDGLVKSMSPEHRSAVFRSPGAPMRA